MYRKSSLFNNKVGLLLFIIVIACEILSASDSSSDTPTEQQSEDFLQMLPVDWQQLPLRFSGFIEGRGDLALHARPEISENTLFEREIEGDGRLRFEVEYSPNEQNGFILSTDTKYWEDTVTHDIYEAYWKGTVNNFDIRLGKQLVTWGRSDEIIPLDIINPQDLRRFFLPLREERKIPVWMATMDYFFDTLSFTTLWVPFFEPHDLADPNQTWTVETAEVPDTVTLNGIQLPTELNFQREEPENTLENGQYGVKITKQTTRSIFDLIYYHGWDYLGVLSKKISVTQKSVLFDIRKKHFRDKMVGASFSTLLGTFVFRGEVAYHFSKYFETEDPGALEALVEKDYAVSCVGLEYTNGDELFMNLLVNNNLIMNHEQYMTQRQSENIVFGVIERYWDHKVVQARMLFYYNIDDGDSRFNPELSYELSDGLRGFMGMEILGGDPDTDWGQFANNDLFYLKFKYSF